MSATSYWLIAGLVMAVLFGYGVWLSRGKSK